MYQSTNLPSTRPRRSCHATSGRQTPFDFTHHRTRAKFAPENTLPAFQAALDLGADGIKLDVQYSSDGKLVVIHNPTLEKTTNGAGHVTAQTFAELRLLDAGSHFDPQFAASRPSTRCWSSVTASC